MKILFVGNYLAKSAGTLSVSQAIGQNLSAEGYEVFFTSSYKNRYLRFASILLNVLFRNYKVIHVDVFSGNSFMFAQVSCVLARMRRKQVILTLHGGALHEFYAGRELAFKNLFGRADTITTPSLFLQKFFASKGYQIMYIPNAINLEKFPFSRTKYKEYSLLWVRAFTDIYNPRLAVLTLKELLKEFPNTTLTMIGPDKGLLGNIKDLIDELGVGRHVQIIGPVPNHMLFTYYQNHHVYLNTTTYESFGVAVLEAASCGIPVVSTSVGEIPYLWENERDILLINDASPVEMAFKVKRIFLDDQVGQSLSLHASTKSTRFNWNNIKLEWINLLGIVKHVTK